MPDGLHAHFQFLYSQLQTGRIQLHRHRHPGEEIARVGRKDVGVSGQSESVSWNAAWQPQRSSSWSSTSDASVASAEETERSDAVVERHDDDVAKRGQRLAVVHPQRVGTAVEAAAVDPHLTNNSRVLMHRSGRNSSSHFSAHYDAHSDQHIASVWCCLSVCLSVCPVLSDN